MSGAIREVDELNDYAASTVVPTQPEAGGLREACAKVLTDAMAAEPVAAGTTAPAGVVRIPGEELLEAIESEEDIVNANRELTEGTPQTEHELEQWRRLYGQIMNQANERLRGRGVMLLVAVPNPNGLGAVFTGVDAPRFEAARNGIHTPGGEDYEVVLTLPPRERVDLRRAGREEFVRKFIGIVCDAVLEQQAAYRARQGLN